MTISSEVQQDYNAGNIVFIDEVEGVKRSITYEAGGDKNLEQRNW